MAFALQNSTIEEQQSVIRFLTVEGKKPAAKKSVDGDRLWGEMCLTSLSENGVPVFVQAVRVWVMTRDQATSDLLDKVDDIARSDWRVTLRMLALKVDVSYGTVWTIVH
ncbi:hypothetical protein TNIN_278911 [Trichonephila inaurata madagascariensis]|uniref:Uncharacterized protein n=1 Tax=Trichonephila inaurata madagascariensis TaxID=2747483 RepID=A0A8X6XYU0_9ARAC|nr:hypothetical protein TNIN_278911 [Trichonephila inaurata madagascariensis]